MSKQPTVFDVVKWDGSKSSIKHLNNTVSFYNDDWNLTSEITSDSKYRVVDSKNNRRLTVNLGNALVATDRGLATTCDSYTLPTNLEFS